MPLNGKLWLVKALSPLDGKMSLQRSAMIVID
jgi:hypothetical protein